MAWQMSHSSQGVGGRPLDAVERLGEDAGGGGLADAAVPPGEQIGVGDAAGLMALASAVATCSWPTRSANCCGR